MSARTGPLDAMTTPAKFEPIPLDTRWDDGSYDETNHDEVSRLLVGHAVSKVNGDHLLLDDGTLLRFVGHEGGCSCSAGDYDLTALNGTENIITAVEFEDHPTGDDYDYTCRTCGMEFCEEDDHDSRGAYRIFVFAGNDRINLASFEGSDGNGCYGTGYHVLVRRPEALGLDAMREYVKETT